jgi:uncharacterized protein (DUF58 family)
MVFRNPFRHKGAAEKAPPDPVADGPATGETGSAERVLRRLEWSVIRRLDGLLQGDYRTLMRGAGLDLADLREYQHHDDVRHIDWNVTARLQVPHVRVFTEDREMAAWFLLDLSPSMDFGSHTERKQGVAAEFVAVLARLLTRHGNRVGALVYGTGVDTVIPARGGRRHVLQMLHTLQHRPDTKDSTGTRLHELLTAAGNVVRRRSTVFVVSDFISEPGWEKPLAQLALRHEVVAVRLHDPLELELPDLGLIPVRCRDRRATDGGHQRQRLSPALRAHRRAARGRPAGRAGARGGGHAGAFHRRRPGGRRRALRRPAPPAHAPGHGRRLAAPPAPGGLSKPTKDRKD